MLCSNEVHSGKKKTTNSVAIFLMQNHLMIYSILLMAVSVISWFLWYVSKNATCLEYKIQLTCACI